MSNGNFSSIITPITTLMVMMMVMAMMANMMKGMFQPEKPRSKGYSLVPGYQGDLVHAFGRSAVDYAVASCPSGDVDCIMEKAEQFAASGLTRLPEYKEFVKLEKEEAARSYGFSPSRAEEKDWTLYADLAERAVMRNHEADIVADYLTDATVTIFPWMKGEQRMNLIDKQAAGRRWLREAAGDPRELMGFSPGGMSEQVDWSAFSKDPEDTCYCRCGTVFRSHSKLITVSGKLILVTEKPCPSCGQFGNLSRVSSDPESFGFSPDVPARDKTTFVRMSARAVLEGAEPSEVSSVLADAMAEIPSHLSGEARLEAFRKRADARRRLSALEKGSPLGFSPSAGTPQGTREDVERVIRGSVARAYVLVAGGIDNLLEKVSIINNAMKADNQNKVSFEVNGILLELSARVIVHVKKRVLPTTEPQMLEAYRELGEALQSWTGFPKAPESSPRGFSPGLPEACPSGDVPQEVQNLANANPELTLEERIDVVSKTRWAENMAVGQLRAMGIPLNDPNYDTYKKNYARRVATTLVSG